MRLIGIFAVLIVLTQAAYIIPKTLLSEALGKTNYILKIFN
jgi:hypothetical protein